MTMLFPFHVIDKNRANDSDVFDIESIMEYNSRYDDRDRRNAEVVGTYRRGDTQAGRNAEQREMNRRGGVARLDN